MDPIAGFEDELLHLGVPTLGLMSEMNARLQQFFDANAQHSIYFLWLKVRTTANHPAENGIVFSVIVARPAHKSAAI